MLLGFAAGEAAIIGREAEGGGERPRSPARRHGVCAKDADRPPSSRKHDMRRAYSVLALCLAAGGCTSLRDEAVPGCPYCGDPVTRVGADGRAEVVPRWRVASWEEPAPPVPAADVEHSAAADEP